MVSVERVNIFDNPGLFNRTFYDALWQIWHAGFDDPVSYFDFFYMGKIQTGQAEVFCMFENSRMIGAAYMIKAENAYYGYAISILPEYRGKGLFKLFAQSFCDLARKKNTGIIIRPANDKLFDYYISKGAVKNMIRRTYLPCREFYDSLICASKIKDITPDDAALCKKIYDDHAEKKYLKWNSDAIKYAIRENVMCGGSAFIFNVCGENHFVFTQDVSHEKKIISETSLSLDFFKKHGVKIHEKPLVTYNMPIYEDGCADFLLD